LSAGAQALAHHVVPLNGLPGASWPALPGAAGQRMLAMQFQFMQSERWLPERLRAAQFDQLALLRHASRTVPYYRERLAGLDLSGTPTEELLSALPLLRREDVQDHFADLRSRDVPGDHGQVVEGQTSGSTGRPIRFLKTGLEQSLWHAFTLRDHLWRNRDFSGKLAAIRGPSRLNEGSATGWGPSTDAAFRTGACTMSTTEASLAAQADWLMRENPEYLISISSNAQALARHCREQGLRPSRLREVRTYGEAVHPDLRSIVREAWGVPVVDLYSCREAGYLALQCPRHEHYHVQSEGVILEILDESGRPCKPGELGRVVITPLHSFAMPFIRYEIGDYAEAGGPCDCGRSLPVIRRVVGRVRNMLRLPDGGLRYPRLGEYEFGIVPAVRQFQVVQKTWQDIEVALVVTRPLTADEEQRLRALILKNLGGSFVLTFVYRDSIPRTAGGKYEDFRSEVQA